MGGRRDDADCRAESRASMAKASEIIFCEKIHRYMYYHPQ
jgi:hypothetical protein